MSNNNSYFEVLKNVEAFVTHLKALSYYDEDKSVKLYDKFSKEFNKALKPVLEDLMHEIAKAYASNGQKKENPRVKELFFSEETKLPNQDWGPQFPNHVSQPYPMQNVNPQENLTMNSGQEGAVGHEPLPQSNKILLSAPLTVEDAENALHSTEIGNNRLNDNERKYSSGHAEPPRRVPLDANGNPLYR